jgi:hypothetical protein
MLLIGLALPAAAQAADYAPVDRAGPPLTVAQAKLDASLVCTGNVAGASRAPVLLVPATGVNPQANYSWNWEPALTALGIPWCTVELPGNSMDDIQVAGEYVVNAIRKVYALAGRKIAVMGHSQGGMIPRWAYRFWPDTRAMVDDEIGLAGSNHGSDANPDPTCIPDCSAAFQQQHKSSKFLAALNSGQETFPGISYTEIYSHFDEVVTPNADDTGSSSLHGGGGQITNVATQDVCPLDLNEHLQVGTIDPVAYALAIDALSHPGPADVATVQGTSGTLCLQLLMPGVNPVTAVTDEASAAAVLAASILSYPKVPEEPPLACYVFAAGCQGTSSAAEVNGSKKSCHKKKKHGRHQKSKSCKRKPGKHL